MLFTEPPTLHLAFYQCLTKILLILLPPPPSPENPSLFTFLLVGTLSSKTWTCVQPRETHYVSASIVWDTILSGCLAAFDPEDNYYCFPPNGASCLSLWGLHISCLPLNPSQKDQMVALWQKGCTTSVCLSAQTWPGFTLVAKRSLALSFENANLYTVRKLMVNGWIIRY